MTAEEFKKLQDQSQPHQVFNSDWETFYPYDFADTLLPDVPVYSSKALTVYDGARLFKSIGNTETKVMA